MMKPHKVDELMNAFLDAELRDRELKSLLSHLLQSPAARRSLCELLLMRRALLSVPKPAMPESMRALRREVSAAPKTGAPILPLSRRYRIALAAVVAAVMMSAGVFLGRSFAPAPRPTYVVDTRNVYVLPAVEVRSQDEQPKSNQQ